VKILATAIEHSRILFTIHHPPSTIHTSAVVLPKARLRQQCKLSTINDVRSTISLSIDASYKSRVHPIERKGFRYQTGRLGLTKYTKDI
jgi:hypothetical protein